MDTEQIKDYWAQKADDELIDALTEIAEFEPQARTAIQAEASRRSITSAATGEFIVESKTVKTSEERNGFGCLGALLVASLGQGIRGAIDASNRHDSRGVAASFVLPIIFACIWVYRRSNMREASTVVPAIDYPQTQTEDEAER